MNRTQPILAMHHVGKSFATAVGPVRVLNDINVTIYPGDFVALSGPSGSGKTTLLNLASLLDHPTEGDILFDAQLTRTLSPETLAMLRREKTGMVFQHFHLLSRRTALENVAFRFRYAPEGRTEAHRLAAAALDRVGLAAVAHRTARLMSGGEMQRTAIARAIAKPPLILFADEPTGNLDSENTARIMELFQQINREGIAILLATHNKALLPFCSRHLICTDGHIIEETLSA